MSSGWSNGVGGKYLVPLTDALLVALLEEALVVWYTVYAVDEAEGEMVSLCFSCSMLIF